MSTLDAVILSEILALKKQSSALPPVGFGVTMAEKGDVVPYGSAKFLRSGILAKLDAGSLFPEELSHTVPTGTATAMFGNDFLSVACSEDSFVLTKNGGDKVYIARRSNNFVLQEVGFPTTAQYRVRYENGGFFFFPFSTSNTVYYSFDDLATISSVASTVANPKSVRFLSDSTLVFLQQGSSSGSSVSYHNVTAGVIAVGSVISLSGVSYLTDLAVVVAAGVTYYLAFRASGGMLRATSFSGPYSSITFDPSTLGSVNVSGGALFTTTSTLYGGRAYFVRAGMCYFFLATVGLVAFDPSTGKVSIAISFPSSTQDSRIYDFGSHFGVLSNAADSVRYYSPSFAPLSNSPVMAGNIECAVSSKLAARLPSTIVGNPIATASFVKFAGLATYVPNLYLRVE